MKLSLCPPANCIHQRNGRLSVQGLSVEQILIAKRNGVLGQLVKPIATQGQLSTVFFEQLTKAIDVMSSRLGYAPNRHD